MAERSRAPASFSRGRLLVGLALVALLASGVAYGLARLRRAPSAGRVLSATADGVRAHDLSNGRDELMVRLPEDLVAVHPSPDGTWVAYSTPEGATSLQRVDGEDFTVADRLTIVVGWSPDGRVVVDELLSDGDLVAIDPEGDRDILMTGGHARGARPVWIGDERFAIASAKREFVVVSDGRLAFRHDGVPLTASPDGAQLMWLEDGHVFIGRAGDEEIVDAERIFDAHNAIAATSPQGHVAIATPKGIFVLEGGTSARQVSKHDVDAIAWTIEGPILVYDRDDAIYALDLRGGGPKRISRHAVTLHAALAVVP